MGEEPLSWIYLTLDEQKAQETRHWFIVDVPIYYTETTNSYYRDD